MALTNEGQKPGGKKPPFLSLRGHLWGAERRWTLLLWRSRGISLSAQSSDQLLLHSSQPCSPVLCDHFLKKNKTTIHENKTLTTYTQSLSQTLLSGVTRLRQPSEIAVYPTDSQRNYLFRRPYPPSHRKRQELESGEQTQKTDSWIKVPIILSPPLRQEVVSVRATERVHTLSSAPLAVG